MKVLAAAPYAPPMPPPAIDEMQVQQQTADIAQRATSLVVTTHSTHIAGQELLVSIGQMRKKIEAFFKPMKDAAHLAHKAVCNRENEVLQPLVEAQKTLGRSLIAFEERVEADRRAEEKRLREEAQAAEDKAAKEEAERLAIEDAIELEAQGDMPAAEACLANPTPIVPRYVPPPVVPSSLTRVAGAVSKTTWKARVVNANLVPREWLVVDESALNRHAASLKERARVAGVEFYPETGMHGRGR